MKRVWYWGVLAVLPLLVSCSKVPGSGKITLSNATDSISAALGLVEAQQLEEMLERVPFTGYDLSEAASVFGKAEIDTQYVSWRKNMFGSFNEQVFKKTYLNHLLGEEVPFDDMRGTAYLNVQYQKQVELKQAEADERGKRLMEDEQDKGGAFLKENAQRPEVEVLSSGLQYEVLTQGSGDRPVPSDRVRCHYHGTLLDGTVFDSSVDRGEPIVFGLGQVIRGWQEALQLMPVGSKWKLYVPSYLAYGEEGAGEAIGPNETLIFEVELLGIE